MRRRADHLRRGAAQRRTAAATRCGRIGVRPEERVLTAAARRPSVRLRVFRRDQDRRGAGAAQHAVEGRRLRVRDPRLARRGADRRAPSCLQRRSNSRSKTRRVAASHHRRRRAAACPTHRLQISPFDAQGSAELDAEPTSRDAPALLALLVGQHRRAEGCVHLHHDMVRVRRAVRQGRARHPRGRSTASASRSCSSRTVSATRCIFPSRSARRRFSGRVRPTPQHVYAVIEKHRADAVLLGARPATGCCWPTHREGLHYERRQPGPRAVVVRTFGSTTQLHAISISRRSVWRCRRVRRCRRRSTSGSRQRFGVDILDGIGSTETLHMFISNRPERDPSRLERSDRAGLRGAAARRRAGRRFTPARSATCGSRRFDLRAATGTSTRRRRTRSKGTGSAPATNTRRTRTASTGACGPHRRHAQGRRPVGESGRGRERAGRARRRARMRRRRPRGSRQADQADGVRRAARRRRRGSPELAEANCSSSFASASAGRKRPRWVEFVAELPKTATGKIQRFKLRRPAVGGGDDGPRRSDRSITTLVLPRLLRRCVVNIAVVVAV